MRTKTRTTLDIRPGMVVRTMGDATYRQVATTVKHLWWAARTITFTDGTHETYAIDWEFTVARGKTIRNSAKACAAGQPRPTALESVFALLGGYATGVVGARVCL